MAAEPPNTAIAVIRWEAGHATVESLVVGADDDTVLRTVTTCDATGIDSPLGWPDAFFAFLDGHRSGTLSPPESADIAWRDSLSYRLTDAEVREVTGKWPLSVAANYIGRTAMRAAALLARLAADGVPVDRAGFGSVIEVYPAAALRHWGLPHQQYKRSGNRVGRDHLVDALKAAAPWLDLGGHEDVTRCSDDALDAVVCALVTRASTLGHGTRPNSAQHAQAAREGWIVLPTCALGDLPSLD